MKITQVMLSKGFGGAERYFVDLCLALAQNGDQVQAICQPGFQQRQLLESCPQLELVYIRAHGSWDRWAAHRIKQQVTAFRPALIHTHLARGTWLSSKAATDLHIPLVVKTHNYVDLKYYRHVDKFIPTTVRQEGFLLQAGIPAQKIARIPNFSPLQAAATPRTLSAATPVFVALGRFVKKKGMDILLRAFASYLQQGGQAKLRIGGAGQEQETLFRLCQALNLTHQVEFCGWINDAREFLSQGDIFILPSLHEPFGIVLLEAMALGLPIITTCAHGPREILNSEAAYFVKPGDSAGLAKALEEAVTQKRLTHQKAATALELFKTQYAIEAVLPQIRRLYQTMAAC